MTTTTKLPARDKTQQVILSQQEFYLIRRLRQLAKNGTYKAIVEKDEDKMRWYVAGKAEG